MKKFDENFSRKRVWKVRGTPGKKLILENTVNKLTA